ncbi:hypothetical protein PHAVU_008G053800 [Phaseolus vulgaris]|uniref:Uncharacterized protein n=1 Tax=Phaseolus vulgaris TaxID=3885 RepID=V7B2E5_PHAVU|nr:hypothetical protein PHAVU_008G053800g [Phaseolus vulgaris]ESW11715.1 hypothetical protein PHAVU_008G053800g [Phaseolus vulgaris]
MPRMHSTPLEHPLSSLEGSVTTPLRIPNKNQTFHNPPTPLLHLQVFLFFFFYFCNLFTTPQQSHQHTSQIEMTKMAVNHLQSSSKAGNSG